MEQNITIHNLQTCILKIDNSKGSIDEYFYKLSEEVGELAKALRKNKRLNNQNSVKGTIEEELYDVMCYVVCLANKLDIDLEKIAIMKEELNSKKYNRKNIFD